MFIVFSSIYCERKVRWHRLVLPIVVPVIQDSWEGQLRGKGGRSKDQEKIQSSIGHEVSEME
jgi:hypothetical protein